MPIIRGRLCAIMLAALCLADVAHGQAYPNRPIRLMVGFAAGGPVDVGARQISTVLQREIGQTIVIENRPGANGAIAGEALAKATPDGYTLLFAAGPTQTTTPHLVGKLSFDPLKDYTPLVLAVYGGGNVLVVRKEFPARTLQELMAYARANPGKVSFGSAGLGASNHLAGELLAKRAGLALLHVPYKGNSQAMVGLLAGDTVMQFAGTTDVMEHIKAGTVRPLGITSLSRLRVLPDVPTLSESGLPNFAVGAWHAFEGPPGLPAAIGSRLITAIRTSLRDPVLVKYYADINFDLLNEGPEALAARVNAEYAQWGEVLKGMKVN